MVGRSASIISPFYSLLLVIQKVHCNRNYNNNKKFFVQSRCIFRLNVFKDSWFYILLAPSSNGQIKLGEYVRVLHIAACWQQAPMVRLNYGNMSGWTNLFINHFYRYFPIQHKFLMIVLGQYLLRNNKDNIFSLKVFLCHYSASWGKIKWLTNVARYNKWPTWHDRAK